MKREAEGSDKPQRTETLASYHVGAQSSGCFRPLYFFLWDILFPAGWLMSLLVLFVCLYSNGFCITL